VTLVVSLAIAFTSSWKMTLIMLGLFPIIGAAFGVQISAVQKETSDVMEATNRAGSIASQAILNIRTVVAFNLEAFTSKTFEESLQFPLANSIRKVSQLNLNFFPVTTFIRLFIHTKGSRHRYRNGIRPIRYSWWGRPCILCRRRVDTK
jgi:ABC-type multidrug transport system fused ATPase/permease subunit